MSKPTSGAIDKSDYHQGVLANNINKTLRTDMDTKPTPIEKHKKNCYRKPFLLNI
jgi:hypothetical protein